MLSLPQRLKKQKRKLKSQVGKYRTQEEMREVECDVIINTKEYKKSIVRTDTGVLVREENLTSEDLQMELQTVERKKLND